MAARLTGLTLLAVALSGASSAAPPPLPPIRHVFVLLLENQSYDATFGELSAAP
jgi:phosphatidylinositol-3-phosphatase